MSQTGSHADQSNVLPPAGWYPDPFGWFRWWDGQSWAPPSPPTPPDNRGLAALSHGGLFAMYFVLPLVLRLTVGKQDPFVRAHATEALNGQITFGIFWNLTIGTAWVAASATDNGRWLLLILVGVLAFVWMLVNSIVGAVRAYHGAPYRYPGNVRLVRGGFAREAQVRHLRHAE